EAARYWFRQTLAFRRPGEGTAGFAPYLPELPGGEDEAAGLPDSSAGFLAGAAGIGLALLAASSEVEPEWDRVLLCSIPPRCGLVAEVTPGGRAESQPAGH